jgi:hypothetical protein
LRVIASASALVGCLSACSVHPIPDDVTRVSTADIVKSIRCEVLAGLESFVPNEMAKAAPIVRATTIGYDFTFGITEDNNANGADDGPFLQFANGGKVNLDLTGHATLNRKNTRKFTIIEPLLDLARDENRARCANRTTRANWTYPIAGKIGMDEVVRTYLKLEMLSELDVTTKAGEQFKNVVFADDLEFTTNFGAGSTTTLVLDAVVGRLKLTNASINVGASRDDVHKVTVALTRATIPVDERKRFKNSIDPNEDRWAILLSDNVRDPRAQARLIEIDEEARTRVAMELYRRRSLNDVDNVPAEALGQRLLDVLKVP